MPMPEDRRDPTDILKKLYDQLVRRRRPITHAVEYYDGAHNLAFASEKFLEAFGGLFRAFADNWCGVVTDAVEERLGVQGFLVSDGETPTIEADKDAKRLWEDNELDLQSSMGHLDGLITGAFYTVTWPRDDDGNVPEITVESASTTIVECHPKIRKRRTAGLRTWLADDGFEHAELFLPANHVNGARAWLYRSRSKRTSSMPGSGGSHWVAEDQLDVKSSLDGAGSMQSPFEVVPVVEFLNMPRLTISRRAGWGAHSEIASVIPLQDAVNKFVADLLVSSEFAAFPQRHLTGYEPAEKLNPETGKPTGEIIPPNFKSGPGRLWWTDSETAKFGQFAAADLRSAVAVVEMVVQHIASISRTPPHYLRASADRLSGESIKSAETGLVAKVLRKQTRLGAGWEETIRLAGVIADMSQLANAVSMETIWRDPETRTESEHIDALGKKKALNVPDPQLWEEAGYSPEQIERFPQMRAQMQLEGMAANAAERARLATVEADRLAAAELEATGGLPLAGA